MNNCEECGWPEPLVLLLACSTARNGIEINILESEVAR